MIIKCFGVIWRIGGYAYGWILIAIIGCIAMYQLYLKNRTITLLAGTREHILFRNTSLARRRAKVLSLFIAIFFLALTLLSPQWGKKKETVRQEGRDVLIALDVSRSMLAGDVEPTRLACAKKCIKSILPLLSCERVGLILFSGTSFVQCPLTQDYSAFTMFLEHVDVETISSGTTALDQALNQALDTFSRMPDKKNKLLIVVTDGEDFSHNLSGVCNRARDEGLHLFTIGVGSPQGAPIPLYDEYGTLVGHQRDEQGDIVISRLNQDMLRKIAQDMQGQYVGIKDDEQGIKVLVDCIKQFDKEQFEEKTWMQLQEQYPYFLIVSFIFFVLEWLL